MTSLPFQFPVLTFGRYVLRSNSDLNDLDYFRGSEDFSICTSWVLRHQALIGMLLIDSTQRCWRISRVKDLGVTGPFWSRILRFLVRQSLHRISCEIEELEAMSLEALKTRVCSVLDYEPTAWGEEHVPEEHWDDPYRWWDEQHEALKARVTASWSVPEIINVLFEEHFDPETGHRADRG